MNSLWQVGLGHSLLGLLTAGCYNTLAGGCRRRLPMRPEVGRAVGRDGSAFLRVGCEAPRGAVRGLRDLLRTAAHT